MTQRSRHNGQSTYTGCSVNHRRRRTLYEVKVPPDTANYSVPLHVKAPLLDDSNTVRLCRFRCPTFYEKEEYSTSRILPPPRKNLLSSIHDTQTCKSSNEGRKATEPDPSAGEAEENQWDDNQVGAGGDEEEEEATSDADKHKTPLCTTKRSLLTAGKNSCVKRCKCRRFSSPLSSGGKAEDETGPRRRAAAMHLPNPTLCQTAT